MKTAEEFNNELKAIPNSDLCRTADEIISKLCASGGKSFTMTLPPRIDDSDIVLSEVVRRLQVITSHTTTLPSDAKQFAELHQYELEEHDEGGYIGINEKRFAELLEEYASAKIAEMKREMKEAEISEDLQEIINVIQRTKDLYGESRFSESDSELASITELVDNYRRK